MVEFYNKVFDAKLKRIDENDPMGFHLGELAGMQLFLCPNRIAGVLAQQNRQQFRFVVEDVDTLISKAIENGGERYGDTRQDDRARVGGISDPDENSIELIQFLA